MLNLLTKAQLSFVAISLVKVEIESFQIDSWSVVHVIERLCGFQFGVHGSSASGDIKYLICRLNSQNHMTERSCNFPAGIYLLKVNNRNTRTRCQKCSKLTLKIPEQRLVPTASFWYLIVNFELISHLVVVFLLLTLNM